MHRHLTIITIITLIFLSIGNTTVNASEITGTLNADGSYITDPTPPVIPPTSNRNHDRGGSGNGSRINPPIFLADNVVTSSCVALTSYMHMGVENNQSEVLTLQKLLNLFTDSHIVITGIFDRDTFNTVKVFQSRYSEEILAPWGMTEPTGNVSLTTLKKLNELSCGEKKPFSNEELSILKSYKAHSQKPVTVIVNKPTLIKEVKAAEKEEKIAPPVEIDNEVGVIAPKTQTASAIKSNNSLISKFFSFIKGIFQN